MRGSDSRTTVKCDYHTQLLASATNKEFAVQVATQRRMSRTMSTISLSENFSTMLLLLFIFPSVARSLSAYSIQWFCRCGRDCVVVNCQAFYCLFFLLIPFFPAKHFR